MEECSSLCGILVFGGGDVGGIGVKGSDGYEIIKEKNN